jgi:excisionase family DNA binding protein
MQVNAGIVLAFQQAKSLSERKKVMQAILEKPESKLLTLKEAAKLLRVSVRTVWVNTAPRGRLAVVRIGNRTLYKPEAVQKFIDEMEEQSLDESGALDGKIQRR